LDAALGFNSSDMGSKLRLFLLCALAVCLPAGPASALPRFAPGPYTVTELKPLKGSVAFAFDVNLAGQATGVMTMETAGSTFYRGFFYDPRTGLVDIGSLGGANTFAERINDHGAITGSSEIGTANKVHAFVYTPGVGMRDLGAGPAQQSFGNDIDESGNVVGSLFPGDHTFRWTSAGGIQDLGPGSMVAFDFTGRAYGYKLGDTGAVPGMWSPPFTTFTPLGPLPDPLLRNGYAYGGNIFGRATGELTGGGVETAFYWDGHTYAKLSPSGFSFSSGEAVNDAGNIVIKAFNEGEDDVPFLYRLFNSDPVNGNDLNSSASPFSKLLEFTSIDDVGHISGAGRVGNEVHGFVLTPSFSTELDTVGLILEGDVPARNPFFKYVETMRRLGLAAGVNPTACFEFRQLRQSLSVGQGVPFTEPQRVAAGDALAAILEQNKCASGLPTIPVTVPHIFSRTKEREQIAIRILRGAPLTITTQFPSGSMDVLSIREGGRRSLSGSSATGKLKITKTRTRASVRVKVSKLKRGGTLRFVVVAKKLPGGKPVPVTTKIR